MGETRYLGWFKRGESRAHCQTIYTDSACLKVNGVHFPTDGPDQLRVGLTRDEAEDMGWELCEECLSDQNLARVIMVDISVLRARTYREED